MPDQHSRLALAIGQTVLPAIRTIRRLPAMLLAPPPQLLFREQAAEFISDLAGQRFQVDQTASCRQLLLMLPRQRLDHLLHAAL